MQEDLKRIKDSLSAWSLSLKKALETNNAEDVHEFLKDARGVESSCDQLVFSLYELKEMIEENESLK